MGDYHGRKIIKGFFAYPSKLPPTLAETIRLASERVRTPAFELTLWEDARIGGKVIITEILRLIDSSDLFIADVTDLNPNVMFELGYAIASKKRIWLILDRSRNISLKNYEQFRLLTTVGYCTYVNSHDIVSEFFRESPHTDLDGNVFATEIEPTLASSPPSGIFLLRSRHETDADRKINQAVLRKGREGLPYIIDDPNEVSVQPLAWYAQNVYSCQALLAHFSGESREDTLARNAREAVVCGIGQGFGKPILLLAEQDYTPPLDYKDLLVHYSTAKEAVAQTELFLNKASTLFKGLPTVRPERFGAIQLATELKNLRIGEYIAENERDHLDEYFFVTSPYRAVVEGRYAIFVGGKGTGKTANLLHAASELASDKRNLVVVIQPVGYDISAVNRLFQLYRQRDTKGFLVASLWKFLIYSEIAQAAAVDLQQRPSGIYTAPERELLELCWSSASPLAGEFAVRLERSLESLFKLDLSGGVEMTRKAISEALHSGTLLKLRRLLGDVLSDRQRVAVLIDNLDQAWKQDEDLEHLSELIFDLLDTADKMPIDFSKSDRWRKPVKVTLSILLRGDIFQFISRNAHERDKLSFSRIAWKTANSSCES